MSNSQNLDSDSERLPEGMTRVGYDADTQTYHYRDADGSSWSGRPGNRYGRLDRAGQGPSPEEEALLDRMINANKRAEWRYLSSFLLLVLVFLLVIIWFVNRGDGVVCNDGDKSYEVKDGDTCWAIAQEFGTTIEKLHRGAKSLDCKNLTPGQTICVGL